MAAVILGGIGLHVLFGGDMPFLPFTTSTSVGLVVVTFLSMMILGPLLNTEEILWRGFAFPRLQSRYGWLVGSLLLAVPEILLHLPYFFDPDAVFYRTVGIFWFSAFSFAAVLLYTWVFNRTRGSLIFVTLLHASQNAWSNILSDNSLRPFQFTVALMWAIALVLILVHIKSLRKSRIDAAMDEEKVRVSQIHSLSAFCSHQRQSKATIPISSRADGWLYTRASAPVRAAGRFDARNFMPRRKRRGAIRRHISTRPKVTAKEMVTMIVYFTGTPAGMRTA